MLCITVRSVPIFTNNKEILTQMTLLNQKERLSLKCQESMKVTHEVIEMMETESKVFVKWSYNFQILKGSSDKYNLNKDYVKVLHKILCSSIGTTATGFTKVTITSTSGERTQFYAHSCFQGHQWYDWAIVYFQEVRTDWESLLLKITWFLLCQRKMWSCDTVFRTTTSLEYSGKIFFVNMKLGTDFSISFVSMVPMEALVHPLCVIPDCGGDSNIYFVVLPKT